MSRKKQVNARLGHNPFAGIARVRQVKQVPAVQPARWGQPA
ncbi:MAG: hypothetical protein ACKOWI_02945 [Rhodoluna sp.]